MESKCFNEFGKFSSRNRIIAKFVFHEKVGRQVGMARVVYLLSFVVGNITVIVTKNGKTNLRLEIWPVAQITLRKVYTHLFFL